jgi:hypothetical protein
MLMKFPLGAMSVGDILDHGLKILWRRLGAFYAINLILMSPALGITLLSPLTPGLLVIAPILLNTILILIMGPVTSGATIQIIANEYLDEPGSTRSAIRFAFARFWQLLGTSIIVGFIVMVGFFMGFVPGIIFALIYALVLQIVMVEGRSGGASMQRSLELTRGFRWRILGVQLVILLVGGVVLVGIYLFLERVFPPGGPRITPQWTLEILDYNVGNFAINQVVYFLIQVVLTAYGTICVTLIYFDLRARKEGFDLEIAARRQSTQP